MKDQLARTLFVFSSFAFVCNNIIEVWSLKCKCDICKTTNYTCETDGYCFTSAFIKFGVLQYNYSVIHK
ncbi:activin receptor type-1B-like [Anoplophora glabripennis]|uniref:activin receptor type-1B-like n=1 Tax=Anoplophora glabripennis TaxID=217634 RepID=UPI000874F579|nr:activin receptor type-1B-like [Anoplophora glabripennis]